MPSPMRSYSLTVGGSSHVLAVVQRAMMTPPAKHLPVASTVRKHIMRIPRIVLDGKKKKKCNAFPEARKIVEASNPAPPSGQNYAKVAAPIAVGKTTCSASTQTNLTWVTGGNPSKVLGPQTSEVQTDESIPVTTPKNSAKDKPSTSQIRSNSEKNIHVTRAISSSQPNKDVHKNKKDENPPKPTKLDKPKPVKSPKPKIKTDRQQKGSQNSLADYNSYNYRLLNEYSVLGPSSLVGI